LEKAEERAREEREQKKGGRRKEIEMSRTVPAQDHLACPNDGGCMSTRRRGKKKNSEKLAVGGKTMRLKVRREGKRGSVITRGGDDPETRGFQHPKGR